MKCNNAECAGEKAQLQRAMSEVQRENAKLRSNIADARKQLADAEGQNRRLCAALADCHEALARVDELSMRIRTLTGQARMKGGGNAVSKKVAGEEV